MPLCVILATDFNEDLRIHWREKNIFKKSFHVSAVCAVTKGCSWWYGRAQISERSLCHFLSAFNSNLCTIWKIEIPSTHPTTLICRFIEIFSTVCAFSGACNGCHKKWNQILPWVIFRLWFQSRLRIRPIQQCSLLIFLHWTRVSVDYLVVCICVAWGFIE